MSLTIAIIGARGGSKSVPKKNIRLLRGYPLIAYSIVAAHLSKEVDRVIVSTDSEEIAEVSRLFGAEVPFLRPPEISGDLSTDREYMTHFLEHLKAEDNSLPEIIVQLRATSPLRDPAIIDMAIREFKKHPEVTGLRSAHEASVPPEKMFKIEEGYFVGYYPDDPRPELHNLPRQLFDTAYRPNGYVDLLRPDTLLSSSDATYGSKLLAFETEAIIDIDLPSDFDFLESYIEVQGHKLLEFLQEEFPL